ncbi:hypothetical protein ACTHQ0_08990 [Priestia megaterium]|uniref:hypothetical protein n=1 Tax=Priestia megaterium TaxID=1404 RepID=UPI003F81D0F4
MKEGYEDYKQKQQQESAQNVDSILERVTAEEKYYLTKTQAIKKGRHKITFSSRSIS